MSIECLKIYAHWMSKKCMLIEIYKKIYIPLKVTNMYAPWMSERSDRCAPWMSEKSAPRMSQTFVTPECEKNVFPHECLCHKCHKNVCPTGHNNLCTHMSQRSMTPQVTKMCAPTGHKGHKNLCPHTSQKYLPSQVTKISALTRHKNLYHKCHKEK